MKPEWSDFRVMLALARAGSLAGAARELQVDQSTVSRRLAALEEALGAKLLIRGGREFSWTAAGRAVLDASETMEAATEAATRAVRASKVDAEGSVRVSVAPAFAHVLMRRMMPTLRKTHPLLHVELSSSFQRADLAKGDADLALRMMRPAEPDLVARRAFDCAWFAYASVNYLEAHGRPEAVDDLQRHALVLYAEVLHTAPPTLWLDTYRNAARPASRMDSIETASQAAAADAGIAVLPAFVGDPMPELVRVFPERVSVNTGWVVYHACVRDNSSVKAMAEALLAFFRAHECLFLGAQDARLPAATSTTPRGPDVDA